MSLETDTDLLTAVWRLRRCIDMTKDKHMLSQLSHTLNLLQLHIEKKIG